MGTGMRALAHAAAGCALQGRLHCWACPGSAAGVPAQAGGCLSMLGWHCTSLHTALWWAAAWRPPWCRAWCGRKAAGATALASRRWARARASAGLTRMHRWSSCTTAPTTFVGCAGAGGGASPQMSAQWAWAHAVPCVRGLVSMALGFGHQPPAGFVALRASQCPACCSQDGSSRVSSNGN